MSAQPQNMAYSPTNVHVPPLLVPKKFCFGIFMKFLLILVKMSLQPGDRC